MAKFRYSLNGGTSWTTIDAALPFAIPSTASQDVLVEPIGAAVLNEKPPVTTPKPVNTAEPVLSGTPKVGQELSLMNGTWSNSPDSYAYRYKADGVTITGATTSKYTPVSADVGKTIVGEVLATNAGGTTVAASNSLGPVVSGPQAVVLPTPSFGKTNAVIWRDISKSYTDSAGNQKSSAILDAAGFETFVALEDLLGNGYGVTNPDKNLQPTKGSGGGMLFADSANAQRLNALKNSALNGANKITYAIRFMPRNDLYGALSTARILSSFSEAATSASPAGGGSTQTRFSFRLSGGAANRRPYITMAVADGATKTTSSSAGTNPLQAVDASKNTAIVTLDMSGSQVVMNMYMNSRSAIYTESWTPAEAAPWAFNTPDSVACFLGDGSAFSEIFADLLLVGEIADSARLDAIFAAMSGV